MHEQSRRPKKGKSTLSKKDEGLDGIKIHTGTPLCINHWYEQSHKTERYGVTFAKVDFCELCNCIDISI